MICLMKESTNEESILQAVRRSVRGEAVDVIMRLGDSIYGNVFGP